MRFISRHADTQESPSRKKAVKVKKVTTAKPKTTKKKAPVKADIGKGLNVLLKVALSEAAQLKEATKQSKKDFYISQASGLGDGTGFELRFPNEQHLMTTDADEGTGTIPGFLMYPNTNMKVRKSHGVTPEKKIKMMNLMIKVMVMMMMMLMMMITKKSSTKYYEEEKEKIDDEETMDEEDDDQVTKELYDDVNVNLGNEDTYLINADQGASEQQNVSQESGFEQVEEDAHVTLTPVLDTQKADEPVQSSSSSSDFTSKLLNLENPSPSDNEIASLMETSARHATAVPEITSSFTTTIHPPPPFFNPLPQQATPTPTPTTSEATTSFTSHSNFLSVFKFNDRVANLEKDMSKIKQVDQYAQALSFIPAIVDCYIDNKLGKAINKAIQAHNLDYRQEAQDEKNEYTGLVDTSIRTIIKEEVTTQLPQILPQAVSDFATPVIEKNVTESLEAIVLGRSSSQPKYTYEAAASLFEYSSKQDGGKQITS
nr:hypothetical protein [Tanacetum cinerariifolium]